MAWYAILESRMQKERRAPQLLSDSEVFTIPKKGGEGPDFLRFINLLDGVGKMIFGGWLELIEDPYRHWQFGFVRSRGVTDCLAIRWAIWERAAKAGWCLSEQQWDIVKAFDMLDREQLFRDVTAPNAPFVTDVLQDLYRQARMHIKKDAYLTRTGVRQGDNLGPGLFRRSYDAATQEWNEQLDARPWARRLVVRYIPMGLPEASIDLSVSGYADDLARAAVAKNLTELGQINREQTDSLRAALKSRSLQLHPTKGIVLLRAAGRNSMKDYQAACTGAWPAPEHISLQAKYLGALRTIEGTAKAECRARCQAAEASFALYAPFFRSQAPQRFKVLVFKQRLWAPCWQHSRQRLSTPMTFTIWRSSSVRWHGVFFFWAQGLCV